ncbi:DUF3445 domain-containing protein [Xinfangfangia sp. D13-10-4-6]|uniref:heme-dependent oxidative N-demethylase family protein n=1 Tax=Pseudogemmobacter hezensis TaxID=2737662 RepID=UPI001553E874|nr:DUF3445 domain-containing protein [Pseudogemmobacter hezensis]NPD15340.1 DUF3445 domain-containing protein [Pseudogemmobacter hezensis]
MTADHAISQNRLPLLPWMDPRSARLPGIQPLTDDSWISRDEAFVGQMARRDALILNQPDRVHALLPRAQAAADELYEVILARLARDPGYSFADGLITRPDGVQVRPDPAQPLLTLGRLVQEDLCILEVPDSDQTEAGSHVLTGAMLCFPASWMLSQKIGRSLLRIHVPVEPYDERLARGVQRLFDAIRPEQPLWRMNFLTYDDAELHQPRPEGEPRPRPVHHLFIRCEKQCLIRLPVSRAVVFSIHTWQVRSDTVTAEEHATLLAAVH